MRKIGIIIAFLCLAAAVVFIFLPRAQEAPQPKELTARDSMDREIILPAHPKRVVILNASNLDLFVAAGGADLVVGKPTSQALSETVKEKTAKAEEVGIIHQPDIEKILSLQPDLVIGTNVPFHTDLEETLGNAGVPIYIQAPRRGRRRLSAAFHGIRRSREPLDHLRHRARPCGNAGAEDAPRPAAERGVG